MSTRPQATIQIVDGIKCLVVPIVRIGYVSAKFGLFPEGSVVANFRIEPPAWMDIMECDDLRRQLDHVRDRKAERERS